MAHSKKPLAILLSAAVIAAGAGAAYHFYWPHGDGATDTITLYGNIDIREADLAFNTGGRIESMLVEEGDAIKKGQLLATLDASRSEAEVAAAKAQVGVRQAALDRLLAGSRPEEIKKVRADVNVIVAELDDARARLRRTAKLAKSDFASQQQLDNDRARVKTLEAQLHAAKQALSLAIQGPRSEDIAEARAGLQAEEAALALAMERLKDTTLHAPADGIVKTRILEPGAVVLAQTPVYTVALKDPVWVRTYIPEPDLGRIHPGMKAEVYTDSEPGKAHEGWIGFISPVAEFTPKTVETAEIRTSLVYRLRVFVKNPDNGLRQGMPVTVRLKPGPAAQGSKAPGHGAA